MRTPILLAALLSAVTPRVVAQSTITGDAWVLGKVAVGTTTTDARFYVLSSSTTEVPFLLSGVDSEITVTPILRVARDGTVGLSTYSAAHLDIGGSGDDSDIAAMLRAGNLSGAGTSRRQVLLGSNGSTSRRHTIASVHADSTSANAVNFQIWEPTAGAASSIATMTVLSLMTSSASFEGGVHVRPVGAPQAELTISNGSSTGGGTLHVAQSVTPSSRKIKRDISYFSADEEDAALERTKALRPVTFRYMKRKGDGYTRDARAPMRRGLLYEEAPESIRGPHDSLSLDQRLVESELAFKALARRIEELEKEAKR